jgi:hypothetical protein
MSLLLERLGAIHEILTRRREMLEREMYTKDSKNAAVRKEHEKERIKTKMGQLAVSTGDLSEELTHWMTEMTFGIR